MLPYVDNIEIPRKSSWYIQNSLYIPRYTEGNAEMVITYMISSRSLLAIRKHCTIASYKLMCWRVCRGSRLASSDATSVVLVEGPSSF